jgi:hypothetical protein
MLDIFNSDAFSVVPLTEAIRKVKFAPGRINQLGLFQPYGVTTTTIAIEEKQGSLVLVPPTARGGPGVTRDKDKRKMRSLTIPHFQIDDAIMAEEVQGIRAFGSETMTETVMMKVAERMADHVQAFEVTNEYSRIGALKGVVVYANGEQLDLFSAFGVSQVSEVDFDLDNASPTPGALRRVCADVIRAMAAQLDGVPFTGLHAFCGDDFFDDLISHPEVRETYLNQQEAGELRTGYINAGGLSWGSFNFGGITFENYRGSVDGQAFVHTDKCHIIPLGVPGLFRTVYAPADYVETVNTVGRQYYVKQWAMPNDKGRNMEIQTNPLHYCTRPNVLIQGRRT